MDNQTIQYIKKTGTSSLFSKSRVVVPDLWIGRDDVEVKVGHQMDWPVETCHHLEGARIPPTSEWVYLCLGCGTGFVLGLFELFWPPGSGSNKKYVRYVPVPVQKK